MTWTCIIEYKRFEFDKDIKEKRFAEGYYLSENIV